MASSSSTTLKQKPKNNQNSNSKTYNVQILPIYFLLFFKQKQVQMISKIIIQYLSLTLLLMRAIYYFRHIRLLSICYSKDNYLLCRHYEYQTAMCQVFFFSFGKDFKQILYTNNFYVIKLITRGINR